jgi:aminopeptidase N
MHGYPWIRSIPDFSKWDGSKFRTMMQDSVSTYRGRAASTADFRAIVAKHIGEDMGWFVDQWVYGTEIPTNQGTWSVEGPAVERAIKVAKEPNDVEFNFFDDVLPR